MPCTAKCRGISEGVSERENSSSPSSQPPVEMASSRRPPQRRRAIQSGRSIKKRSWAKQRWPAPRHAGTGGHYTPLTRPDNRAGRAAQRSRRRNETVAAEKELVEVRGETVSRSKAATAARATF